MTIKRTVNGVETEFELTANELWEAYQEEQWKCDIADIENAFEDLEDKDTLEIFGKTVAEMDALKEHMASVYRKYMDNCDHWIYERDEAIADVLNGRR